MSDHFFGIPITYHPDVPKGKIYVLNGSHIFIGTYVPPIRQTVASIITSQRIRRGRR